MNDPNGLNVVLLAAGRGSRMSELTSGTHKSLLPLGGRPGLQWILDAILAARTREVVLVTGYQAPALREFVEKTCGDSVKTVDNPHFDSDTNILSVNLGVNALSRPERGYLIVETDIAAEPKVWQDILSLDPSGPSVWVTRGRYSRDLTGGALKANQRSEVEGIVYAPGYDPAYEGWQKLLGVLFVGPQEASTDRDLRKSAVQETIRQYYMTPWCRHLDHLPCKALSLGDKFAFSFNDSESYRRIDAHFARLFGSGGIT